MKRMIIDPVTKERKVYGKEIVTRTEFGLWLNQNMMKHGMKHIDVARKLHVCRGSISSHASGYVKPTFMNVISYCWLFGGHDDPEEIYKLTDKTIES